MKDLSKPFNIPSHKTSELVTELGKMPVGGLIGNILTACVDAQTHAADTAWKYTQRMLEKKDPVVFTFQDQDGMKRIEVPVFTIVPLPYLRLDNVDIDFDAEASINNLKSNEFLVTVNNSTTEGNGINVVQGSANLHIGINAGTSDMPAGLAMLLKHMGDGLIVEDIKDIPATEIAQIVDSIKQHAEENAKKPKPPIVRPPITSRPWLPISSSRSSGSGKGSGSSFTSFSSVVNSINQNSAAASANATNGLETCSTQSCPSFEGNQANGLDASGNNLMAIHVTWTAPSRQRYNEERGIWTSKADFYKQQDFEVLSTVLSALLWRKFNGPIKLYTDSTGLEYYENMDMLNLWNGGIDAKTLGSLMSHSKAKLSNKLNEFIPPDIFWAAGKIFATKAEKEPFVMMDTDMLVWANIQPLIGNKQVMAFHPESLNDYNSCYLPYELLKKRADYKPMKSWDWKKNPYNTALVYYSNSMIARQFKLRYTSNAIDFMRGNEERPQEMVSQMVFAEQRIFGMETATLPAKLFGTFLSSADEQSSKFTHLWGSKAEARDNAKKNLELCTSLAKAIRTNFVNVKISAPVQAIIDKYR